MEGIKRVHRGERAWRELLARHEAGGESVSAFCRSEGLSVNSLRRWRERLTAKAVIGAPCETATNAPPARGFVDLGLLGGTAPSSARLELTLDLGGGITLHVVRG